jgi:hypothetical protein
MDELTSRNVKLACHDPTDPVVRLLTNREQQSCFKQDVPPGDGQPDAFPPAIQAVVIDAADG